MNVNFEIAALFPSPFSRVKKGGNFKTSIHLDSVESFLYYLSSRGKENLEQPSCEQIPVANSISFCNFPQHSTHLRNG